ncbi:hypothetical protein X975_16021, partial [Stegodyphus mimosarum]
MMVEVQPASMTKNIDGLVEHGLSSEAEQNFQLAKYALRVLCKTNEKARG